MEAASDVSPTAQDATRFACLFLRSTKVPPNTETVPALRGRPGGPHQGRLNLWLCLVLNTRGLTHPHPSPLPAPLFESQFVQLTPDVQSCNSCIEYVSFRRQSRKSDLRYPRPCSSNKWKRGATSRFKLSLRTSVFGVL